MSKDKSKTPSDNKFDLATFNKDFSAKKEMTQRKNLVKSQKKLDQLMHLANTNEKSLYQQSILDLLIGIKNTWFGILDDLLARKIDSSLITKNNRLFYIGLTIILITIMLYLYNFFLDNDKNDELDKVSGKDSNYIIEKHYIYDVGQKPNVLPSIPENKLGMSVDKSEIK